MEWGKKANDTEERVRTWDLSPLCVRPPKRKNGRGRYCVGEFLLSKWRWNWDQTESKNNGRMLSTMWVRNSGCVREADKKKRMRRVCSACAWRDREAVIFWVSVCERVDERIRLCGVKDYIHISYVFLINRKNEWISERNGVLVQFFALLRKSARDSLGFSDKTWTKLALKQVWRLHPLLGSSVHCPWVTVTRPSPPKNVKVRRWRKV